MVIEILIFLLVPFSPLILLFCFITSGFFQAVGVLAKSTTFAKNPRQLQFEADINKLFMYTRLVITCFYQKSQF